MCFIQLCVCKYIFYTSNVVLGQCHVILPCLVMRERDVLYDGEHNMSVMTNIGFG